MAKKVKKQEKEITIKKVDYYGFNHELVNKKFTGGLTFCNEFCVNGEYRPVAVYRSANPDKSKGHKRYLLLQIDSETKMALVRGMDEKDMKKWRYQDAVLCLNCNTLLYSINRHHFHGCGCKKEVSIDGGKEYTKLSYPKDALYKIVQFDLIANEIVTPSVSKRRKAQSK